jgi:hypothetical protein
MKTFYCVLVQYMIDICWYLKLSIRDVIMWNEYLLLEFVLVLVVNSKSIFVCLGFLIPSFGRPNDESIESKHVATRIFCVIICCFWLKFIPCMLHLEHSFIWCWNLDASGSRSETPGKFWIVALEKDGKDQLDWSCLK